MDKLKALSARSVESANGLVYIPSFRDNGEFPEHIWASLNGEAVRYVRERTCKRVWTGVEMICSICAYQLNSKTASYCPNCGAKVERGGA